MKSPIEFIEFAVRQAKAAECFGFRRNEACRNLKIAIHQYWQNKTLGLHSTSQKAKIPRSKAALNKPLSDLCVEHAVPLMHIVNVLMDDDCASSKVRDLLEKNFAIMLVTKEEHAVLNKSGLRSRMPRNWDTIDVLARYKQVGIEPADASRYPMRASPDISVKNKADDKGG